MAGRSTRHIEVLLPTVASYTGDAALTGTGSATTAGTHDAFGAAALTGLGSSTTAGTRTRFGIAALTGLGSMTVAGVRTRSGAAALSGAGSLTAAGTVSKVGAAALTGTGSSTSAGVHIAIGAAALQGNGTLSTNGTRTRFGFAALAGTGSLTAAGTVYRSDSAALTGAGSLTASGVSIVHGAAALTGTGTMTASFLSPETAAPPRFVTAQQRRLKQRQPQHVRGKAALRGLGHMEALAMIVRPAGPATWHGASDLTATSTLTVSGGLVGHAIATATLRFEQPRHHQGHVDLELRRLAAAAADSQTSFGTVDLIAFGFLKAGGFAASGGITDGQRDAELLALIL